MTAAWISHPSRMHQHWSLIQHAKLAFGFPQFLAIDLDAGNFHINPGSNIQNNIAIKVGTKRPTHCNQL